MTIQDLRNGLSDAQDILRDLDPTTTYRTLDFVNASSIATLPSSVALNIMRSRDAIDLAQRFIEAAISRHRLRGDDDVKRLEQYLISV